MHLVIAAPLYPPEVGGPATYAHELVTRFRDLGITVSLITFSRVRGVPRVFRHIWYGVLVWRAAKGAQAVLGFDSWSTGAPALCAARLRGIPFVARIGGDFLWERYVARTGDLIRLSEFYATHPTLSVQERIIHRGTRALCSLSTHLVFNSLWLKNLWEQEYALTASRTSVIQNTYPEITPYPSQGYVMVSAGRAHTLKNYDLLTRVVERVRADFPEVVLDTRVLDTEAHRERLKDAYAVVIPSVSEVSPNSAIDALQYGKPVILSSDTGITDRLGSVGMFVDTRSAEQLETALRNILNPREYERRLEAIRSFSFVHSWEEVTREFITLLERVCAHS